MTTIIPMRGRVVICKDDERQVTKGGILLPDEAKIPVITGRVTAIASDIENDPNYYPLKVLDKVLVDPRCSVPADFESGNKLFIIPADQILAILEKND